MNNPLPPTAPIKQNPTAKPREFVMKSQQALINTYSWECCLNCERFTDHHIVKVEDQTKHSGFREDDQGEMCTLYMVRPPAKVIIVGCESYEPQIPF